MDSTQRRRVRLPIGTERDELVLVLYSMHCVVVFWCSTGISTSDNPHHSCWGLILRYPLRQGPFPARAGDHVSLRVRASGAGARNLENIRPSREHWHKVVPAMLIRH